MLRRAARTLQVWLWSSSLAASDGPSSTCTRWELSASRSQGSLQERSVSRKIDSEGCDRRLTVSLPPKRAHRGGVCHLDPLSLFSALGAHQDLVGRLLSALLLLLLLLLLTPHAKDRGFTISPISHASEQPSKEDFLSAGMRRQTAGCLSLTACLWTTSNSARVGILLDSCQTSAAILRSYTD